MSMSVKRQEQLVNGLRSYLRGLARKRSSGVVTADDAHNYLSRQGVREQQTRTRLRLINSVLNAYSQDFDQYEMVPSTRPAARGRKITAWELV